MKKSSGVLFLLAIFALNLFANPFITWVEKEFECPLDKQKNTFLVVTNYAYMETFGSKYQWVSFPESESPTFYICKKCHLATYTISS